jgi:hypothetical protein
MTNLEALGLAWATSPRKRARLTVIADPAWEAQLAKLAVYKAAHGDCNVPQRWAGDPQLGVWVSYQRACKKCLDRGDPGKEVCSHF